MLNILTKIIFDFFDFVFGLFFGNCRSKNALYVSIAKIRFITVV